MEAMAKEKACYREQGPGVTTVSNTQEKDTPWSLGGCSILHYHQLVGSKVNVSLYLTVLPGFTVTWKVLITIWFCNMSKTKEKSSIPFCLNFKTSPDGSSFIYIQTEKNWKQNIMKNTAFDMQIKYIVLKNMCALKQM